MIGQAVPLATPLNTQCFLTDRLCVGYGKRTNKMLKKYYFSVYSHGHGEAQINQTNDEMLPLVGMTNNRCTTVFNIWMIPENTIYLLWFNFFLV